MTSLNVLPIHTSHIQLQLIPSQFETRLLSYLRRFGDRKPFLDSNRQTVDDELGSQDEMNMPKPSTT